MQVIGKKSADMCRKVSKRRDFIVSVLLSSHGKRVGISCIRNFKLHYWFRSLGNIKWRVDKEAEFAMGCYKEFKLHYWFRSSVNIKWGVGKEGDFAMGWN